MDNAHKDETNCLDERMHKKVEVKEDGRLLIYYNFDAVKETTKSSADKAKTNKK